MTLNRLFPSLTSVMCGSSGYVDDGAFLSPCHREHVNGLNRSLDALFDVKYTFNYWRRRVCVQGSECVRVSLILNSVGLLLLNVRGANEPHAASFLPCGLSEEVKGSYLYRSNAI